MTLSTPPDVARTSEIQDGAWRPPKPEMEIPIERNKLATRFQRLYTHICDHAGLVCDTADIARRWLVSGIQEWPPLTDFGSRTTLENVDRVISETFMAENMGLKWKSRRHLSPLKSYFEFRFSSRRLEFR